MSCVFWMGWERTLFIRTFTEGFNTALMSFEERKTLPTRDSNNGNKYLKKIITKMFRSITNIINKIQSIESHTKNVLKTPLNIPILLLLRVSTILSFHQDEENFASKDHE